MTVGPDFEAFKQNLEEDLLSYQKILRERAEQLKKYQESGGFFGMYAQPPLEAIDADTAEHLEKFREFVVSPEFFQKIKKDFEQWRAEQTKKIDAEFATVRGDVQTYVIDAYKKNFEEQVQKITDEINRLKDEYQTLTNKIANFDAVNAKYATHEELTALEPRLFKLGTEDTLKRAIEDEATARKADLSPLTVSIDNFQNKLNNTRIYTWIALFLNIIVFVFTLAVAYFLVSARNDIVTLGTDATAIADQIKSSPSDIPSIAASNLTGTAGAFSTSVGVIIAPQQESIADLRTQISALQAQINTLDAATQPPPPENVDNQKATVDDLATHLALLQTQVASLAALATTVMPIEPSVKG